MKEEKKPGPVWRFVREHPIVSLLVFALVSPVATVTGLWLYLHHTIPAQIRDELHALGLPANGLELETWHAPDDDGNVTFMQALREFAAVSGRIGDDTVNRLTNEPETTMREDAEREAAQAAATAPAAPATSPQKPEVVKVAPSRREQLTAFYHANKDAYQRLFAELQPVKASMAEAMKHANISYRYQYRIGVGTKSDEVTTCRIYAFAYVREAEYMAYADNQPNKGLGQLLALWRLQRKIHAFADIEHLVILASDGIIAKSVDRVLQCPGLSAGALKAFGGEVMNEKRYDQTRQNLTNAAVGELCKAQTFFDQLASLPEWGKQSFDNRRMDWSSTYIVLVQDIDRRVSANTGIEIVRNTKLPYTDFKGMKAGRAASQTRWLPLPGTDMFFGSLLYNSNGFFMEAHIKALTQIMQAGIAATVAGERLDGTPWPENLEDARFPRDPYTGLAFRLLIDADSVYIWSPGADGKDSGLVAVFQRTGCMKDNREVPACANEDDVVFRLSRAVYEPGRR